MKGFLKGGIAAWIRAGNVTEKIQSITPEEFAEKLKSGKQNILDVRKLSEYESGHAKNAILFELSSSFQKNLHTLDKEKSYFIHCARGYRSMIASSILKANGFENIVNIHEGYAGIKKTDAPVEVSAETSV